MRKIKLYAAISLNGRIAKPDGSVDWLESVPNPEKTDYGYSEFYESVDTTIQGYNTYDQIIRWGIDFPYKNTKNYVLSRKQKLTDTKYVEFITENHIDFVKELKKQKAKDIWLIGGGKINTLLLNEGLINEIQIFVMPIILRGGIELFEFLPKETQLELIKSKTYKSGAVEMKYKVL